MSFGIDEGCTTDYGLGNVQGLLLGPVVQTDLALQWAAQILIRYGDTCTLKENGMGITHFTASARKTRGGGLYMGCRVLDPHRVIFI